LILIPAVQNACTSGDVPMRLRMLDDFLPGVFANFSAALRAAADRSCQIHILDSTSDVERVIPFDDANRKP